MTSLGIEAEKVRNGIFLAASRTYAEQYVEPFIRFHYDLFEPTSGDHDGVGSDGLKYEIKACKVLSSAGNDKKNKSLIERIIFENLNIETGRMVPFAEHLQADYLANVQNVKRDHFDHLIYVLLFSDCLKVFKVASRAISVGNFKNWSDKHGRYDQLGKSGQFGITKATIGWHLNNHLYDTLTWEQVTEICMKISS